MNNIKVFHWAITPATLKGQSVTIAILNIYINTSSYTHTYLQENQCKVCKETKEIEDNVAHKGTKQSTIQKSPGVHVPPSRSPKVKCYQSHHGHIRLTRLHLSITSETPSFVGFRVLGTFTISMKRSRLSSRPSVSPQMVTPATLKGQSVTIAILNIYINTS